MGEIQSDKDEQVEETDEEVTQEAEAGEVSASTDSDGQLLALQSELQQVHAKADEYLDGWQRARAEFANYKKRIERERDQVQQNAAGNIIKRYLDIVDDLDRALKNRPQNEEGAIWAEGIELIYRKFLAILESEGVKVLDPQGKAFDPNQHEAISQEESPEHESGSVLEVLQQGYTLGDRVLRPARVRVAK
jgi:molecular chaperone GrpE